MYDSILVATDGSDGARAAVADAVDLADRLEADLAGVSVVDTRTEYDLSVLDAEEARRPQRERAERALAALEDAAEASGITVETTRREGVPHEEILEAVDERGIDLVVMGATGRSSFRRAILGSTVDRVVRLGPVPVLVVGDDGDAREA